MTSPAIDAEPKKGPLAAFAPFPKPFWVINGVELFERGAYYGMLSVLAVFISQDLNFPPWLTGVLLAIQFPLLYFLPVASGAMAEKFGFKKLLVASFAFLIAGYAVLAFAVDFATGLLGIVLYGIGAGLFKPMPAATVSDTTSSEDRNFGFAIYYWLINLGAFLAPLGMVWAFGGSFRGYFLVSAALSVLNLLICLAIWKDIRKPDPSISVGKSLTRIAEIVKYPSFAALILIYSGFWFMYAITTSYMQIYAVDQGILSPSQIGLLVPANALAILLVGPIISKLTGKLPSLGLMIAGITIFCSGFLLIGFVPFLWALFAGILVYSVGEFLTHPSYLAYVSKIAPPERLPVFLGYGFLAVGIGQFAGTFAGGFLYQAFAADLGSPQLFWVAIVSVGLLTVAALLIYNMLLTRKAQEPTPERRRGLGAAPVLAIVAILLIPALVFAGTAVEPADEPIGPVSLGDGLAGSVLQLAPIEGTVEEGERAAQDVTLPANLTGSVVFTLTWTDEAASGPGAANAPDTLKLHVMLPNGTMLEMEAANPTGGEGVVEIPVEGLAPGDVVGIQVEAVECGEQAVMAGPLGPLPGLAGGSADTGNAWTLAVAAEVA